MSLTMANMRAESYGGCIGASIQPISPCFLRIRFSDTFCFMGQSIGVCLLGCGVVGGGVQKILREQRELLRARTGLDFELVHVAVKDRGDYPPDHEKLPMSTDANAAIDDPR